MLEISKIGPLLPLRYRVADAVNDQLKKFGGLHRTLKRLLEGRQQPSVDVNPASERVSPNSDFKLVGHEGELPLPPLEMRELVGPTNIEAFDNPTGALVYPYLPAEAYERVFDFGCGCGRVARQLIQQKPQPRRYLGIDLHRGMIAWCQRNLRPVAPNFNFVHHDVFNLSSNSKASNRTLPFPARNGEFSLVNALSVFTHLTEEQAPFYLRECARTLRSDGILHASWFLFDKRDFPMMREPTNALYVQYADPSAAVIVDRDWVRNTAREFGLTIFQVIPPQIRGFQWVLMMAPAASGRPEVEIPEDHAPHGSFCRRRGVIPGDIGQD
jgi:SAM-dependent methyltransferase